RNFRHPRTLPAGRKASDPSGREERERTQSQSSFGRTWSASGNRRPGGCVLVARMLRRTTSLRWLAGALLVFAPALAPQAKELSPEKAYQWLEELSAPELETRDKAERRLIRAQDASVAAALVELVFFSPPARPHAVQALAALLGEDHGQDYKAWI